ncbi:RNA polymerase sigma factor [Qipengyuania sp.]|uniref:RNA polymerase sigma factor n=1 Tax=Qipengyuania sp. TaxID=2004515 RepID=UPI003BABA864
MDKSVTGLGAVFLTHRERISRFLVARLGNVEEAEEVLQEVWVKIETTKRTGPVADPLAYVFRIADNVAHDRARLAVSRKLREQKWVEITSITEHEALAATSPEGIAIDRQRLEQIQRILNGLPERTRRIFRAYRLEEIAQKDIAAELGISLSAVEKHLQAAYKAIAEFQRDTTAENGG